MGMRCGVCACVFWLFERVETITNLNFEWNVRVDRNNMNAIWQAIKSFPYVIRSIQKAIIVNIAS